MYDEWRDGAFEQSHHMQMFMSGWLPPKAELKGPTAATLNKHACVDSEFTEMHGHVGSQK